MNSEIKGLDKINKIVNEFVSEFDLSAEMANDFAYYYYEDLITYSLIVSDLSSQLFMLNFKEIAPDIECDIFISSLLHEIGHSETIDLLEQPEVLYCHNVKKELDELNKDADTFETAYDIHKKYFNLPDERLATDWAINYMRNNVEKIKEFENKMDIAMNEMLELNLDKLEVAV